MPEKLTMSELIDLVSRLRKENEELNIELMAMRGVANTYKEYYKRTDYLLTEAHKTVEEISENWEIAKTEAVKEFWDKLKQKQQWDVDLPNYVFVADGDELVKEMVGE